MTHNFLRTLLSPPVLREQAKYYGKALKAPGSAGVDAIGLDEAAFIRSRDSFYMATISPDGWPYLQHRGGPSGFLRVRDSHMIGFADFTGNRQLLSTGNLASSDRVALFLMDYARQERLKILGHAEIVRSGSNPLLDAEFAPGGIGRERVERIFLIRVTGLSWNCPQHITPRFTAEEIQAAVAPLYRRINELELALKNAGSAPATA